MDSNSFACTVPSSANHVLAVDMVFFHVSFFFFGSSDSAQQRNIYIMYIYTHTYKHIYHVYIYSYIQTYIKTVLIRRSEYFKTTSSVGRGWHRLRRRCVYTYYVLYILCIYIRIHIMYIYTHTYYVYIHAYIQTYIIYTYKHT